LYFLAFFDGDRLEISFLQGSNFDVPSRVDLTDILLRDDDVFHARAGRYDLVVFQLAQTLVVVAGRHREANQPEQNDIQCQRILHGVASHVSRLWFAKSIAHLLQEPITIQGAESGRISYIARQLPRGSALPLKRTLTARIQRGRERLMIEAAFARALVTMCRDKSDKRGKIVALSSPRTAGPRNADRRTNQRRAVPGWECQLVRLDTGGWDSSGASVRSWRERPSWDSNILTRRIQDRPFLYDDVICCEECQ
jgi:hypothetical protein